MNFKNNINKKKYPEFLELDTSRNLSIVKVKFMEQLENRANVIILILILQLIVTIIK